MSSSDVRQECPGCKSAGLVTAAARAPDEAIVCPMCDGKGWMALRYKPFTGRRPLSGIASVRRSTGVCQPPDAQRTGEVMSYDAFQAFFPDV